MNIVYIVSKNGQCFRITDKMACAELMLRHGYTLIAQLMAA